MSFGLSPSSIVSPQWVYWTESFLGEEQSSCFLNTSLGTCIVPVLCQMLLVVLLRTQLKAPTPLLLCFCHQHHPHYSGLLKLMTEVHQLLSGLWWYQHFHAAQMLQVLWWLEAPWWTQCNLHTSNQRVHSIFLMQRTCNHRRGYSGCRELTKCSTTFCGHDHLSLTIYTKKKPTVKICAGWSLLI